MYETVNRCDFHDRFNAIRPDNFSYDGLCALFEYLEDYEEQTGTPIELDVIALCCDYHEDTMKNIAQNYNMEFDPDNHEAFIEALSRETVVIWHDDESVLYQDF